SGQLRNVGIRTRPRPVPARAGGARGGHAGGWHVAVFATYDSGLGRAATAITDNRSIWGWAPVMGAHASRAVAAPGRFQANRAGRRARRRLEPAPRARLAAATRGVARVRPRRRSRVAKRRAHARGQSAETAGLLSFAPTGCRTSTNRLALAPADCLPVRHRLH